MSNLKWTTSEASPQKAKYVKHLALQKCDQESEASPSERFLENVQQCTVHITRCKKAYHENKEHIEEHIFRKVCALSNSGGGVLILNNADYEKATQKDRDTFFQRLEHKLKCIIDPSSYGDVFDVSGEFNHKRIFLFVKAPGHVCTVNSHLYLLSDTSVTQASYMQAKGVIESYSKDEASLPTNDLNSLPKFDPNEFEYGKSVSFHECKQIQLKYYPSNKELLREEKIRQCMSAFANCYGGQIFIGIADKSIVYGQSIANQEAFAEEVRDLVEKFHWGFLPEKGVHWDVEFFPVKGSPCNSLVIVVSVAGMKSCGGVFTKTPESFYCKPGTPLNEDGECFVFGLEEWKQKVFPRVELQRGYRDSSPAYVKARGPRAIAAYHRALAHGKTCDKRVKILLVGQDGVGKTSLAKALRGEPFDLKESSTDGVEMTSPVKNAGVEAWRNPEPYENLTVFDHKVSATVSRELRDVTTPLKQPAIEPSSDTRTDPSKKEFQMHYVSLQPEKVKQDHRKGKMDPLNVAQDKELAMPPEVASLVEEQLKEDEISQDEKIWPIIWDFAGQDIYRAIHPIFMSPDDIYVLVFDLTKQLNARAECRVRLGEQEYIVTAHDSEDTNLDHMLRWMALINSLQNCSESDVSTSDFSFPPVIVVGTHATSPDPETDIALIRKHCSFASEKFQGHIVKCLPIDNTKAGMTTEQEKIVTLRREILDLADKLPHTKKEIPLQWHLVEKEISRETWQQQKYLQKETFREEIASPICKFESEDDFDELLYFLHARGSIIYHEHSLDHDGLVILDSQWFINVLCEIVKVTPCCKSEVYSLHNDREELKEKGILSQRLFNHACKNQNLDPIKGSLISLMEKFNLICRWPGSRTGNSLLLVPCMLGPTAKEENAEEEVPEPVYLTFDGTNYVPSGFFCRLVVLFGRQLSDPQHKHKYKLYANKALFALDKDHYLQLVCYKTVIKVRISVADGTSTSPEAFNKIVSFCSDLLHNFLKTLKNECHWLRSVTENVCARCTVCLGKSTKSCFRHNKEACRHHDCSHYIPLNSDLLCCEPGSPRLSRETLEPWIQALKKLESTDNTAPKRKSLSVSSTEDSNEYETAAHKVEIKDGVVEDEELEELSEKLGNSWEKLARRLGFAKPQIEGFHKDNEELAKKALGMLEKWKEKCGSDATYRVLYKALCHNLVERRDLAGQFCIVHDC